MKVELAARCYGCGALLVPTTLLDTSSQTGTLERWLILLAIKHRRHCRKEGPVVLQLPLLISN